MPYKLSGKQVPIKRGDRWAVLKTHKTAKEAAAHLAALNANVGHGR